MEDLGGEKIPAQLEAFMKELEAWAVLNEQDARQDTIRFWSLKVPAVLSSASAGLLALIHWENLAAALAALASACILIDAVNPGGQLRNAHLRAVHDLRDIQYRVINEWRVAALKTKHPNHAAAAAILESAVVARARVQADLRTAETSFAGKLDGNERQG
jgi:hypothetical protein